jgi:hypothetical protein
MLIAGSVWFLKLVIQLIVYNGAMKKLEEKDLLPLILIFDIVLLFIYPALQLSKKFVKPNKWKS